MSPPATKAPPAPPPAAAPKGNGKETRKIGKLDLSPRTAKHLPIRLILQAVEGFGKTTIGAYTDDPVFIMAPGEDGYDVLLSQSLVPAVPVLQPTSWPDLLATLSSLAADPQGRRTVVLDALGGFERMNHEHVCQTDFKGEWSDPKNGFLAWHKGYDVAIPQWLLLLNVLDQCRDAGLAVVLLAHVRVANFKNPMGADYDRYVCDLHAKTWGVTHKWSDAVLFGNFLTIIEAESKSRKQWRGKGIGGTERVIYTQRHDAYDAKNRYGLPPEIWLEGPDTMWSTIWQHFTATETRP